MPEGSGDTVFETAGSSRSGEEPERDRPGGGLRADTLPRSKTLARVLAPTAVRRAGVLGRSRPRRWLVLRN